MGWGESVRALVVATPFLLAAGLPARSAAQAPAAGSGGMMMPPRPAQIVTSGEGEARLTPDRATILIGVQTRAPTAARAGDDNARKQRAIIDTLRKLGLAPEQLSTQGYSVYPETRYDKEGQQPVVTGYVVSNNVRAEVRRVDQVGAVIDASLAKGANQISSLEFSSSNTDEARRSALAAAVAKARGDAEAMARAAGGSLGGLIELSSGGSSGPPIVQPMVAGGRAMMAAAPTPVEPGQQTVRVVVTARWAFEPAPR